ncbi:MAG: MaoC family dehydratase N-terminal domain-containing protein [Pseudomonadales bacterium]|nr:MaoC family dehydratase N-terminal domain-containing protein [Pseudomonadales bacterium]
MADGLSADLVGTEFAPATVSWTDRDVMLYALGVGSQTETELDFLYEGHGPKVLPTYAVIPGMKAMGSINKYVSLPIARMLHGEQGITLHRPIPPSGEFTLQGRISEIWDKGEGKAAVIGVTSDCSDSNGLLFSTHSTLFLIGGGGFGGERGPSTSKTNLPPDRAPDHEITQHIGKDQGALYRLSGDRVALHIDPEFARKAGYDKPFAHGLCTFGFVGRAALSALCGGNPAQFKSFSGRFAERVEFEDAVTTKIWVTAPGVAIVQSANQHGKVVLSQARVEFAST